MRAITQTVLLLAFVLSAGCQNQQAASEAESDSAADTTAVVFNEAGAPTVEFSVPGMMCEAACATKVRLVLSEQPGVVDAMVDFPSKKATVAVSEGAFDAEAAIAALADYQFDATLLDAAVESPSVEGEAAPNVATPESEG